MQSNPPTTTLACVVCETTTGTKRCSACHSVSYCSQEHQRVDWASHRDMCKRVKRAQIAHTAKKNALEARIKNPIDKKGGESIRMDDWMDGMGRQQAWDWLIDCYRLRVDDSYVYGGELRGVYDPAHTGRTVSDDFLLFCKLAVKHGVIPDLGQNWGWDGFLKLALGMIPYAFEKSDAHEKYSAKNRDFKFNPMLPVLLTMRFVGARVYGFDLTGQGAENAKDFQELSALIERSGSVYNEKGAPDDLYMEVGGESGWDELRAGITPYYDAEERENGDFDEWRFN